jgi:hypothetical protein
MAVFPNSAPDSLTPKNLKVLTLFSNPVDGAAKARTAVLARTRRLLQKGKLQLRKVRGLKGKGR